MWRFSRLCEDNAMSSSGTTKVAQGMLQTTATAKAMQHNMGALEWTAKLGGAGQVLPPRCAEIAKNNLIVLKRHRTR
jgi:hypothetical protein